MSRALTLDQHSRGSGALVSSLKLLIVSPHFPPTNAADMQRVRLITPYLDEAGIEATVLAVDASIVNSPLDPWLADGVSHKTQVYKAAGLGKHYCKVPGLGTLANRAYRSLQKLGNRQLAVAQAEGRPFDLVYFSTTQFGIHSLGPYWRRKFGVPFVMDYQDPWVSHYYRDHPHVRPPGGRLKYGVAQWLARRSEPKVLRECSGITSVSPQYPEQLRKRYPWLPHDWPVLIAPFPGDSRDIDRVRNDGSIQQTIFNPLDGYQHWLYVGRGGEDMHAALRGFFEAVRRARNEEGRTELARLRIHFVGTSYAAAGKGTKTIEPLANEYGLKEMVTEHTDRIPYSQTLRCLLDAHALIVPGSDDPAYTASKIYPYLLAKKPLLAIFHQESSVMELMRKVGGGVAVGFGSDDSTATIASRVHESWFRENQYRQIVPLDEEKFAPYTAREQAKKLADFFRTVLDKAQHRSGS